MTSSHYSHASHPTFTRRYISWPVFKYDSHKLGTTKSSFMRALSSPNVVAGRPPAIQWPSAPDQTRVDPWLHFAWNMSSPITKLVLRPWLVTLVSIQRSRHYWKNRMEVNNKWMWFSQARFLFRQINYRELGSRAHHSSSSWNDRTSHDLTTYTTMNNCKITHQRDLNEFSENTRALCFHIRTSWSCTNQASLTISNQITNR